MRPPERMISKTENGLRNSGSLPWLDLTITNWPGLVAAAISGAARVMTL